METTTSDHDLIRNAISNIAVAFDRNTYAELRSSLTEDCVADYTGSLGLMNGIDTVIEKLRNTIGHVTTLPRIEHASYRCDTFETCRSECILFYKDQMSGI